MSTYAVVWDGTTVTLPAIKVGRDTYRDDGFINAGRLAYRLVATHHRGGTHEPSEPQLVPIRLIPRPDNDYNEWAVSIAVGPEVELDDDDADAEWPRLDERHLGFLFDRYLDKLGMQTLHQVARYSEGGEIRCHAYVIQRGGQLHALALPGAKKVRDALRRFLDDPATPDLSSRPTVESLLEVARHGDVLNMLCLHQMGRFAEPAHTVDGLTITTAWDSGRFSQIRTLELADRMSERHIGRVINRMLFLEDERDRPRVLELLAQEGISVIAPTTVHPAALAGMEGEGGWPADKLPNTWTYWFVDGLDFRPRDPTKARNLMTYAQFNPTTSILYVEDEHLVTPACLYAARLGLQIAEVKVPARRWQMTNEFWHSVRKDLTLRVDNDDDWHEDDELPRVQSKLQDRLPAGLLTDTEVKWFVRQRRISGEVDVDDDFWMYETRIAARTHLFPDHELTGLAVACRICDAPAAQFRTPGCCDLLAYCHGCLDQSLEGGIGNRAQTVIALRHLAEHEFSGTPPMRGQLTRLHLKTEEPTDPVRVDVLMLTRWAVNPAHASWTDLLSEADLLGDGVRRSRGIVVNAIDGHLCLSMQEKAVDDFLHIHGIAHTREPLYPYDADLNPRTRLRGDWLLADGTLVEMWGLPNNPAYAARMQDKARLCARNRIRLVGLVAAELRRMPVIFADWLDPDAAARAATWTPPTRTTTAALRPTDPLGDDRGRNTLNRDTREARLTRAREALEYQQAGFTRVEIAEHLGIAAETVKLLLRDAKFYADNAVDPGRLEDALAAADARKNRLTKADFRVERGLTAARASQAWKDADVIFEGTSNS